MLVLNQMLMAKLRHDTKGQDLVEYALIAGFVAVAAGAIFPLGLVPGISKIFWTVDSFLSQAGSQGS